MAYFSQQGLSLKGIVSVFPDSIEDNLELNEISETDRESLVKHTGIRFRRRFKSKDARVKHLFEKGIEELVSLLNWDKSSVDLIIVVTQTAKFAIPSVACELQGDLNFQSHTLAYDVNLGCSGFVYGLHACGQSLQSLDKSTARAILCCGDISSQITASTDMTVRPIFSDGVSVTGIEFNRSKELSYFNLETFGQGKDAIHNKTADGRMVLNGIDVYNYSVKYVPQNITSLYQHFNQSIADTSEFILHQANALINNSIIKKLEVDQRKAPSTLYDFGNTSSASIPVTISKSKVAADRWVLLSGFGVGFSVASCLMRIGAQFKSKFIHVNA